MPWDMPHNASVAETINYDRETVSTTLVVSGERQSIRLYTVR